MSAFERDSNFDTDPTVIDRNKRDLEDVLMARQVVVKLVISDTLSESIRKDATW